MSNLRCATEYPRHPAISDRRMCSEAYRAGGGSGDERCGAGSGIARNSTAGVRQSKGRTGGASAHAVSRVCPSRFRTSKITPGRASSAHRRHSSIASHSDKEWKFNALKASIAALIVPCQTRISPGKLTRSCRSIV